MQEFIFPRSRNGIRPQELFRFLGRVPFGFRSCAFTHQGHQVGDRTSEVGETPVRCYPESLKWGACAMLTFRCSISCLCVFLFVGLGGAASQTVSAPPVSLPSIFLETDINPGVGTSRAAWIWDGHHYQATWENGAKAEMTVESAAHGSLVIRRNDPTGPLAGLTEGTSESGMAIRSQMPGFPGISAVRQ
jgi:hypothetical protein